MLKTSHLQEMKRRYFGIYAPKPEEIDEHCGVCGEEDEKESIEEKYVIKHRKNKNRYLSNKAMDNSKDKRQISY